ncbi:hypothetical protein [Segatella copri]|uniref:Major fimbrial subunit protein N-terminal domain-containing protein n=1 Tax=Segatella copri TaxID=165179 RepID=A0AAW5I791_9BACT|nr:hypothetical protein [Segatella copri]MCP9545304.1 hypothetical protein [Segatella copri]MCP9549069.1 hypothetical protein [Segatella copri]MCP9555358.1 hypothetical protein [Segatella copri]MCP9570020.1 hypothetical protein [Segatella copri]
MKRYQSTLTKMTRPVCMALAALLMVGAMASCSENENTETAQSDNAYLSLSFSTGTGNSTRAGESHTEDVLANNESKADPNSESDFHSIKVWVFQSGTNEDANPIAYKEEALKDINGSYNLQLRFLRKIAGKEVENIDLYILANSESTNIQDKLSGKNFSSITRKELQNISFDSTFGIQDNGNPQNTKVPETGLPISRAITNISVEKHVGTTEAEAATKGIKIPLVRAVSKLHFYFARKTGTENVKVTSIEVEGNTIPTASYIFPDETEYKENDDNQVVTSNKYNVNSNGYVSTVLKLNGVETDNIKEVEDPEKFKKNETQTAQDYLDAFKKAGIAPHNLCYLRETTKAIKGKIHYSLGTEEKSVDFSIPTGSKAIRNRELVVYGYFLNGQMGMLTVTPTIKEWQDGGTYDYNDPSTEVIFPDADKTDWGYKVYYGQPQRGPMITLKDIDTKGAPWILQTDNPLFGFVECNEDGSFKAGQSADSYKIESYIINKEGAKKTLYFYVVPKNRLDMAQPHNVRAHVFLTKNPNERFVLNPDFKLKGCITGEDAGKDIHFEQVL